MESGSWHTSQFVTDVTAHLSGYVDARERKLLVLYGCTISLVAPCGVCRFARG